MFGGGNLECSGKNYFPEKIEEDEDDKPVILGQPCGVEAGGSVQSLTAT